MMASMLIAFPIVFYISPTVKGGNGNDVSVSQEFVAEDNTVTGGDITQVSSIQTGDPISGGDSGGNNIDSVTYTEAGSHNGLSYARIPDGADTWKWTA